MPASPIRKLAPYADAAKARGVEVLHLNIGQPDVPSPTSFWNAIANHGLTTLEYSPSNGLAALRTKAAQSYCDRGIDVTADQIIVTCSGSEALAFAIGVICDQDDEIIVPEPMYANYIGFGAYFGAKVVPIATRIEDGFALPPARDFDRVVSPRTKAIVICNPNNPTGTVYSRSELEALAEVAKKHNLFIIADEVYRDFNYTGQPVPSVLQLPGLDERVIMTDSVSKRYSLCGARIGFLVSRNAEFNGAALRFAQARLSPPTLESIGVIGAFDTPEDYFAEMRDEYMARRDVVVSRIRAIPGAMCPDINGAFYATVRLPIDDGDRFCQWLLESFTLANRTVMFAPASGFYATPGAGKDEIRIAYVLNCEKLGIAMDILEAALAAYPGRLVAAPFGG